MMAREAEKRADVQSGRPIDLILEDHLVEFDEDFDEEFARSSTEEYVSDIAYDLQGRYVDGYTEQVVGETIGGPNDDGTDQLIGNLDHGSEDRAEEGNLEEPSRIDLCLSQGIECESLDEECNYSDYEGVCRQVTIYRFHNQNRHCYSANIDEGVDHGWNYEGALMRLFVNHREGRRPVYRCISNEDGACYLSNDSECEGTVLDALLGYTSRAPIERSMPLLRCLNPNGPQHLSTMAESECTSQDWIVEGSLGYVIIP